MSEESLAMSAGLADELVGAAAKMSREEVKALQKRRLELLVAYAREHSVLFRKKYAALPAGPALGDLPPLSRSEAAAGFEDWLCLRPGGRDGEDWFCGRQISNCREEWICADAISKAGVDAFLSSLDNLRALYLGRYRVLSTPGTTGLPLVMLHDQRHNMVQAALLKARVQDGSRFGHIERLSEADCRVCGIMGVGGFHFSYLYYLHLEQAYQKRGLADRIKFIPVDAPLAEMTAQLEAFQPELLMAYPSTLRVLAAARQAGRLHIAPLGLLCTAEYLSAEMLAGLEGAFNCPALNSYCLTEAGAVAMACSENHLHVNADWVIVEPVDQFNKPARPGIFSDGALITNLANLVQPVIRYRVSDRLIMRDEPCPCGLPFPYLEIDGRKEDILVFAGESGEVMITPPMLISAAMRVKGCLCSQFVQRSKSLLEVRYEILDAEASAEVSEALLRNVREELARNRAANVRVYLSGQPVTRGRHGGIRSSFAL